jgi:hypothetical protein
MHKLFLIFFLFCFSAAVNAQVDYSGKYGFQNEIFFDKDSPMKPGKNDQGRMGELTLLKLDSARYKFWLFTSRGWPSYNMGNIVGVISIVNGKAVYREKQDYSDSSCVILFSLHPGGVEIEQKSTDFECGFGHSVYADGEYAKKKGAKLNNNDLEKLYEDFTRYQVVANRAIIFEDESGRKNKTQYFIKNDKVIAVSENDGFVYVEYIAASGKFIYGWIKKSDLKEIK